MREPIPQKGAVLTQISAFWFERLGAARAVALRHRATPTRSSQRVPALAGPRGRDRRPRDARAADDAGAVRVRGARLSLRLGVEGVPRAGTLAGEPLPAGLGRATGSIRRSSPPPPRPRAGTTRTSPSTAMARGAGRRRSRARLRDAELRRLSRRPRPRRVARASSSPTPSSSSAATPTGTLAADRRSADAGQLALLAGRPLRAGPERSRASTSSRCATTSPDSSARGPLERRSAAAAAAGRRGRGHQPALPRGVPAPHRPRPGGRRVIRTAPEGRWFIVGACADRAGADRGRAPTRRRGGSSARRSGCSSRVWVVAFFRDPERAGSAGRAPDHRAGGRQGREHHRGRRAGVLRRARRCGSRSS